MFNQHYPNLVLLSSPLPSLKASLPKMTLLDSELVVPDDYYYCVHALFCYSSE